jgi:hypothetical protein
MRSLRSSGSVGGLAGNRRVYPEADCRQRLLLRRSRFRQQLTPSVDLTSDVKSREPLFEVFMRLLSFVPQKSRSQSSPTGEPAAIRGLVTT